MRKKCKSVHEAKFSYKRQTKRIIRKPGGNGHNPSKLSLELRQRNG